MIPEGYSGKKTTLILVILLAFVSLTLAFETQTVEAGSNGQQIRFDCPFMVRATVRIVGRNQNGHSVVWQRSGVGGSITTTGSWWVGWVRVSYRNSGGRLHSQQVFVPRFQPYSDIYYVRC